MKGPKTTLEKPPAYAGVSLSQPSELTTRVEQGNESAPPPASGPRRRYAPFRDHRNPSGRNGGRQPAGTPDQEAAEPAGAPGTEAAGGTTRPQTDAPSATSEPPAAEEAEPAPPTPGAVEGYRIKLEERLLDRYNNLPATAGKVAKVQIVATRPLEVSLDGRFIKAEFDQLVFDIWGKRMPGLEKEYYVVTFGSGGVAQVRSDPSIRVGLDQEKTYSERAPLAADPFRNVKDIDAPKDKPSARMPGWWRPEFPELR